MILYLNLLLLILSITGYFLFFTNRCHIKISFIPSLFCAWCSSLLFAAGLLNLLPEAAWLLYLSGFVLLAVSFRYKYKFSRRDRMLYAAFILVLIYFFCLMRNAHVTSYDNFSHWATVVKDMLIENRMPNFEDTMIRFQSYPLGSSLFLYYICRFLGTSEDCMLWAQMFMLASFLFSLTAFLTKKSYTPASAIIPDSISCKCMHSAEADTLGCKCMRFTESDTLGCKHMHSAEGDTFGRKCIHSAEADTFGRKCMPAAFVHALNTKYQTAALTRILNLKNWPAALACILNPKNRPAALAYIRSLINWPAALACILYSLWALTVNTTIYELRVDTLLPLAGTAAFAVIYDYRKEPNKALCCSTGLFILLLQIKNSGVYFYAVCLLFLTTYTWNYARCHKLRFTAAALLLPLGSMCLWKNHVASAFPNGMESKHSMSISNYGQMLAKKSTYDLINIAQLIVKRLTALDSIEVQMTLALTVLFLILAVLLRFYGQSKQLLCMLGACWGCMAVYTISLYAMYVFSMPMGEAGHLASYDRYILSVLIFVYGISMIYIIDTIDTAYARTQAAPAGRINTSRIDPAYLNADTHIHDTHSSHANIHNGLEIFQRHKNSGLHKSNSIHTGKLTLLLLTAALAFQVRLRLNTLIQKPDYKTTARCSIQKQLQKDGVKAGDSCMIYCRSTDYTSRYLFYLMRYELWTDDILIVREKDFDKYKHLIHSYDYFMIWDKDTKSAGAVT